jgi:hypothetical protein
MADALMIKHLDRDPSCDHSRELIRVYARLPSVLG